jgi:cardiolipin synthase
VGAPRFLNVPNTITLFRLVLIPIFLVLFLSHRVEWALACFGLAAVSDALDGFFARLLNQRSKLGAILDPIADKLLIVAALTALTLERRLPLWLVGLIALQNLMMIVGALMVKWKRLEIPAQPSRIGKYATFTLLCLIVLSLVSASPRAPTQLRPYLAVLGFISAQCIIISTIQYFVRFGYLWFAPSQHRSRPKKLAQE